MLQFVKVIGVGLLISFLGQLPLGNMNLSATQLSVQEGYKQAWKLGLGMALVEVIYLRIALTGMDWVIQHALLFTILGWLTVGVFLVLGVVSLVSATKQKKEQKGMLINNRLDRFLLGASLSAINPVQIPFWFTWSIYMMDNGVLEANSMQYNFFTLGAGLGSLLGIAIYIHGGKWLIKKIKAGNKKLNLFIGCVFIVAGLVQLYKLIFSPWTAKKY